MSDSSRRRHSKWDHRDSEVLSENFFEKDPSRKTREPSSPSRGSRRHESNRRERIMLSDREDDNIRPSTDLDEWRYQHQSRSPGNDCGLSYRSRSRSRSRSPAYNNRREPALTERSRGKSGGSATICRDFIAGRCRKGTHCFFLHQDAEFSDSRGAALESSPPDSWENKDRRIGGSRYSADDSNKYSVRNEKAGNICNDFLNGRCRRGSSCRFVHHEGPMADAFEKGPADDVYRDRDKNHRNQDNYPDRNHDRETYRRVVTPCKYFAVGNCRNGNHCKFSHQVQENFSPERRSRGDRRESDRKLDRSPASDEPRWSDATRVSNVLAVHDWEEDKETLAVSSVRPGDDSLAHGTVEMKQTQDDPSGTDEPKTGDERLALQWKTQNNGASIGVDNISGDMEISPRGVSTQNSSSLYSETPSLSNISFPTAQLDTPSETPHDKHYHYDIPEPQACGDPYAGRDTNCEDKLNVYTEEGKNNVGSDRMCITHNPPMNIQPVQSVLQNDPHVIHPNLSINPPPGQLQLPFCPSGGDTMQLSPSNPLMNAPVGRGISPGDPRVKFRPPASMHHPAGQGQLSPPFHSSGENGMQTSLNRSSFFDNGKAADGPPGDQSVNFQPLSSINLSTAQGQLSIPLHSRGGNGMQTSHNFTTSLNNEAVHPVPNHSTVSNEQLAQLSHLSLSLAQLLGRQQQLNLSSASNPSCISSLPDTAPSIPSVSNATIQPSQVPEAVKQHDPICDIIEQKMPESVNQMLPDIVEQKSLDNELCSKNINVNQQEPYKITEDGENCGKIAEGESKAPQNKLSENITADDGDEDGKKSKDLKGLRSFKFALADYTKELLKPAWKDGKVNKESYKTIVKKVVDKVIETQGPQIPQTKEKIDQYLSCSKTKLEKLVQAYVGKYKT